MSKSIKYLNKEIVYTRKNNKLGKEMSIRINEETIFLGGKTQYLNISIWPRLTCSSKAVQVRPREKS